MKTVCDVCKGPLPQPGFTACAVGDCNICEDCVCKLCEDDQTCQKECSCHYCHICGVDVLTDPYVSNNFDYTLDDFICPCCSQTACYSHTGTNIGLCQECEDSIEKSKEQTLIIAKPEAVEKGLIGEFISKWEKKGYILAKIKVITATKEQMREHYKEHSEKSFYRNMVNRMTRGAIVIMVWQGTDVINWSRKLIGKTNPQEAAIGTIRGDYAQALQYNMVHASDSPQSARREIRLWFD